jgi:hypothetical protein
VEHPLPKLSALLSIQISTRPSQVNLEEEFRGDQVLSCRSLRGFPLDLAHLAENGEKRILMSLFIRSSYAFTRADLPLLTTSPVQFKRISQIMTL